jgi:hypothetical protein
MKFLTWSAVWLALLLASCAPATGTVAPAPTLVPATTTTQPTSAATGAPAATRDAILRTDSCGTVAKMIGDGAQIVVDIVADGVTTQYNLQYQFAYPKDSAIEQAGLLRAAQPTTQLIRLMGRQVAPDTGLRSTVQLREYMAAKVGSCASTASLQPKPNGFALPPGCGYVGSPTVGTAQIDWQFDCGEGANPAARATLSYSLTQQGWTNCSVVTASATWAKGALLLGISEGAGGVGGYPRFSQPTQPRAVTGCA